jgi:hypothetical protein
LLLLLRRIAFSYRVQYRTFPLQENLVATGVCVLVQVRCEWAQLCIAAEDVAVLQDALAFAAECGRMKFVRPLYKALHHSTVGKAAGMEQFVRLQDTLHPIARKMVAADLGV